VIRDRLIDTAEALRLDGALRSARATLVPRYRSQQGERAQLRCLLHEHLTPTSNCIDIGAYRGRMLHEIMRVAPNGRHIAYEPNREMHARLVRRFATVDVRLAACGERPGETSFTIVKDSPGLSGFRDRWSGEHHRTEGVTVRVESLDTDLPVGYVPHFIKVDVEGAEKQVFEGAARTIFDHKPVILFEHGKGGADLYGTGPSDIYGLLVGWCGMRIFDLEGHGPYGAGEFEDAFETNQRWDFVARA
jgi:FkbM family methyltransferase